ncbi:Protein tweety homolog [Sergentomyia squamirostris]
MGMSAAAAAASKCATLRQGGRYGGNLGVVRSGASPSPNLKTAQPPTVATVSKDYTSSYSTSTLPFNANVTSAKRSNVASTGVDRKEETKQQSVYSIDASYHRQPTSGKPQDSLTTKGISILNQPLPEIPQSAMKMAEPAPKNTQQPLCAANLNQYRSLQRAGVSQKSSFTSQQPQPSAAMPLKSSMKQPQPPPPPPKIVPPELPPKNKHKDLEGRSQQQRMSSQSSKSQNFNTLQYPSKHHQSSTHTTFGYDTKSRDSGHHGYQQNSGSYQMTSHEKKHSMPQQYESSSSRMSSFHGGDQSCNYPMKVSKSHQSGYQTMPHQPKQHLQYQSASKSHGHHQQSQSSKQSSKRDDPPVYYRSLQRGGGSHNVAGGAHNDLYSVTEL